HITRNPSSRTNNSPPKVNDVQVPVVSAVQGKQGTWKIQVSDGLGPKENLTIQFLCRELNEGYVTFGGNPKGGKITGKGKIKTGQLDFDDVYFVKKLKFNIFSVSQMCDKKNSILFTDTECLVLSSDFKLTDESQVLLRFYGLEGIKREFSVPNTPQQNGIAERKNRTLIEAARTMLADSLLPIPFWAEDAAFDGKEHDLDVKKLESQVILFPSSNAQSKEQDDQTKKEAKGKSPVESVTGYRDLNAEFQDCSKNNSNEVTTSSSIVPTVGKNSLNSTNTFSVAGPSNTAVILTYGKTSDIDASQLLDDLDMLGLEDIIYSDDEDVVGAEANFNNLESSS
nr:ribonuclease H-like domain-containing protein [Tanacetum cinerariifolium]